MAKAQVKTAPSSDESLDALRTRITAILESNGFSGTKTAEEVTAAVGEHLGADLGAAKEESAAE